MSESEGVKDIDLWLVMLQFSVTILALVWPVVLVSTTQEQYLIILFFIFPCKLLLVVK